MDSNIITKRKNYIQVLLTIGKATSYNEAFECVDINSLYLKYIIGLEIKNKNSSSSIDKVVASMKYLSMINSLSNASVQGVLDIILEQVQETLISHVATFPSMQNFTVFWKTVTGLCSTIYEIKQVISGMMKLPRFQLADTQYFKRIIKDLDANIAETVNKEKIMKELINYCLKFEESDVDVIRLKKTLKKIIIVVLLSIEYCSFSAENKHHIQMVGLLFKELLSKCESNLKLNSATISSLDGDLYGVISFWNQCHDVALKQFEDSVFACSELFSTVFYGMNKYTKLWQDLIEIAIFKNDIQRLEEALRYSLKNTDIWKPTLTHITNLVAPINNIEGIIFNDNITEIHDFVTNFKKELHSIEQLMIHVLESSFQENIGVKEGCMILDSFHNLSKRTKIEELYMHKADQIIENLKRSLNRASNNIINCYSYISKIYSKLNIGTILHHFYNNKMKGIIEMLQFSSVYLNDESKIMSIKNYSLVFKAKIEHIFSHSKTEYKNIHDPRKLYNSFLLKRNRNNETYLDVNVHYEMFESCFYNIIIYCSKEERNSTKDITYHKQSAFFTQYHRAQQVVNQYNYIISSLSHQEYCIFQGKMKYLHKMILKGIYKMNWQNSQEFKNWTDICKQTTTVLMENIIAYKKNNAQMHTIIHQLSQPLNFHHYTHSMLDGKIFMQKMMVQLDNFERLVKSKFLNLQKKLGLLTSTYELFATDQTDLRMKFNDQIMSLLCISFCRCIIKSIENLLGLVERSSNPPFIKLNISLSNLRNELYPHKFIVDFVEKMRRILCSTFGDYQLKMAKQLNSHQGLAMIFDTLDDRMNEIKMDFEHFIKNYDVFRDMSAFDPKIILSKYEQSGKDVHVLETDIETLHQVIDKSQHFYFKSKIHFYCVDNKRIMKNIYTMLKSWEDIFMDKFYIEFSEKLKIMSEMEKLKKEKRVEINSLIEETSKLAEFLRKYNRLTNQEIDKFDRIKYSLTTVKKGFRSLIGHAQTSDPKSQFSSLTKNILGDFMIVTENFYKIGPFSITWKHDEAIQIIQNHKEKLENFKDWDSSEFEVIKFNSTLKKLMFIWTAVKDWYKIRSHISAQKPTNISFIKAKTYIMNIFNKLKKADELNLVTDLKSVLREIKSFSQVIYLADLIQQPNFQEDHFKQVRICLNINENFNCENIGKLEDIEPLLSNLNTDIFNDIQIALKHESVLSDYLQDAKVKFKNLLLNIKTHKCGINYIDNIDEVTSIMLSIESKINQIDRKMIEAMQSSFHPILLSIRQNLDFLTDVSNFQRDLISINKVFQAYTLSLQMGQTVVKVSKLTKIWSLTLSTLITRTFFTNITIDPKVIIILKKMNEKVAVQVNSVKKFIDSRKIYFPRLFYNRNFNDKETLDIEQEIHLLFPCVKQLIVQKKTNIIGYETFHGEIINFDNPIILDHPIEVIYKEIHISLQKILKKDINESYKMTTKAPNFMKIIYTYSHQVLYVNRMLTISKEIQRISSLKSIDKKSFTSLINGHENILKSLIQTTTSYSLTEQQYAKLLQVLNTELAIKNKINILLQSYLASKDDISFALFSTVKYLYQKTDDINVVCQDFSVKYGYETYKPTKQTIFYLPQLEKNVSHLFKNFMEGNATIVKGFYKTGKRLTIAYFAFILGRYFKSITIHKAQDLDHLLNINKSEDILALNLNESSQLLHDVIQKIINMKYSKTEYVGNNSILNDNMMRRIFLITRLGGFSEKNDDFSCFNILKPNLKEIIKYVLLLFKTKVKDTFTIQKLYVMLLFEKHYGGKKINFKTIKLMLHNYINESYISMQKTSFPAAIYSYYELSLFSSKKMQSIHDKILNFAAKFHVQLSSVIYTTLHKMYDIFEMHDFLILHGESMSHKSTVVNFLMYAHNQTYHRFSSFTFAQNSDDDNLFDRDRKIISSFLNNHEECTFILEGRFEEYFLDLFYPLHNQNYFTIQNNKTFKNKKIKFIFETMNLANASPRVYAIAYTQFFKQHEMSWSSIFKRRLFEELRISDINPLKHLFIYFEKFYSLLTDVDNSSALFNYVNFSVYLLKSYYNLVDCITKDTIISENLCIFIAITALFQNVLPSEEIKYDILIRKAVMKPIPEQSVIFDYYFDVETESWKLIPDHGNAYYRILFVTKILLTSQVNIEIVGRQGSGKTTVMNKIQKLAADNFGVECHKFKVHSGANVKHLTILINKCIKKQIKKLKKNPILLMIDDIDIAFERRKIESSESESNDLELSLKYMFEYSSWLDGDGNTLDLKNVFFITSKTNGNMENLTCSVKSLKLYLDDINLNKIASIYDKSLKNHFSNFEIDIKFLVDRLIVTTVKIFDRISTNFQGVVNVEDFERVIRGFLLSHRDCHDTKNELFDLWANEMKEIIVKKLDGPIQKTVEMELEKCIKEDFVDANFKKGRRYGYFTNKYSFYVELEEEEVVEHIETVIKDYEKEEREISNYKITDQTIQHFCIIMKILKIESRHLYLVSRDEKLLTHIVKLCCSLNQVNFISLTDGVFSWKKKLRKAFRLSGIEDKKVVVHVVYNSWFEGEECMQSLTNLLNNGYDSFLLSDDEFWNILQDNSSMKKLSFNVKKNLHCIINADHVTQDKFVKKFQIHFIDNIQQSKEEYLTYYQDQIQDYYLNNESSSSSSSSDPITPLVSLVGDAIDRLSLETYGKTFSYENYKKFIKIFFKYLEINKNQEKERDLNILDIEKKIEVNKVSIQNSLDLINSGTRSVALNRSLLEQMSQDIMKKKKEENEFVKKKNMDFKQMINETLINFKLQLSKAEDYTYQNAHYNALANYLKTSLIRKQNLSEAVQVIKTDKLSQEFVQYVITWLCPSSLEESDQEPSDKEMMEDLTEDVNVQRFLDELKFIEGHDITSLHKKLKQTKSFDIKKLNRVKSTSFILYLLRKLDFYIKAEKVYSKSYTTKIESQSKKLHGLKDAFISTKDKLQAVRKKINESDKKRNQLSSKIDKEVKELETLTQETKDKRGNENAHEELNLILNDLKTLQSECKQYLLGTLALGAAFLGYCGESDAEFRTIFKARLGNTLKKHKIQYSECFLPFVIDKQTYEKIKNEPLLSIVENMVLFNVTDIPVLIIDPLDISFFYLKRYMDFKDVQIIHAGDPDSESINSVTKILSPTSIELKKSQFIYITSQKLNSMDTSLPFHSKNILIFELYPQDLLENIIEKNWRSIASLEYKGYLNLNNSLKQEFEILDKISSLIHSNYGEFTVPQRGDDHKFIIPKQDLTKVFVSRICCLNICKLLITYTNLNNLNSLNTSYNSIMISAVNVLKDRSDSDIKKIMKKIVVAVYKSHSFIKTNDSMTLNFILIFFTFFTSVFSKQMKMNGLSTLLNSDTWIMVIINKLINIIGRKKTISPEMKRVFSFLLTIKDSIMSNFKDVKGQVRKRKIAVPEIGHILAKHTKSIILLLGGMGIINQILYENSKIWTNTNINLITPSGEIHEIIRLLEECMLIGKWIVITIPEDCTQQYFEFIYFLMIKSHMSTTSHSSFQLWIHSKKSHNIPMKILQNCKVISIS